MDFEVLAIVLSILVTVLIGWQISTIISIDSIVKRAADKAAEEQTEKFFKMRCEIIGTSMYNLGVYQLEQKAYAHAFSSFLKALSELYIENPESAEVQKCFDMLYHIIGRFEHAGESLELQDYVRDRWVDEVAKIENPRKMKIIKFLMDCPVTS